VLKLLTSIDRVVDYFRAWYHTISVADLLLFKAVINDDTELANHALEIGANVNTCIYENPLIHIAIKSSSLKSLKFLIDNGADVNAKNLKGTTALHYATMLSQDDSVKLLIQNKADVNAKDLKGITALHYATVLSQDDSVKLLIQNKADVNAKDLNGATALHYATELGEADSVKLLIQNKADVNAKTLDGHTPLYFAATDGNSIIVKILIENGGDINANSDLAFTMCNLAASEKDSEIEIYTPIIKLLVENGLGLTPEHQEKLGLDNKNISTLDLNLTENRVLIEENPNSLEDILL
jgi:ankyrin repeat protein